MLNKIQIIKNLDFNVVRDIAPSVPTTLATPQTGGVKVYKNNYFSKIQTSVQSNYSNTVVMLLTHYNFLFNVKRTPWVSIICLLWLAVT